MRAWTIFLLAVVLTEGGTANAETHVDPADEFTVSAVPGMHQYDARIWGNIVVWTVDMNGDVWAENTETDEVFSVGQGGRGPANIHDGRIVWGAPAGASMFDVETRETTLVSSDGGDPDPDIYGPLVVWVGTAGIRLKNIETGEERLLASSGDDPAIFGDTVVWYAGGMQGYRLSSQTPFEVSASGSPHPDLSGDIAVWWSDQAGNRDISAANVADPLNVHEFVVCTDPFEQGSPAVYGNTIVWTDYRNGDMDVYGYDIAAGIEFPIATGPGNQFRPAIYESLVVWSYEPILHGEVYLRGNYIVPEPAGLPLLALGGLAMIRRRKRQRASP